MASEREEKSVPYDPTKPFCVRFETRQPTHYGDAMGYAMGYYLHRRYVEHESCTPSRHDRVRAFLARHERAITWTLNLVSFILAVAALILAMGCSRETPAANDIGYPGATVRAQSGEPEPSRLAGVAMTRRNALLVPTVVQLAPNVASLTAYVPGSNPRRVDTLFRRGFAFCRIPEPGNAVKFEVIRCAVMQGKTCEDAAGMYSRAHARVQFDPPGVTSGPIMLPVAVDGPIQNVRIIVIGMDASGAEVFVLPDTRLIDLPRWVGP